MKRLLGIGLMVIMAITLLIPVNTALAKNNDAHKIAGGGIIDSGNGPLTCTFTAQQIDNEYGAKGQIMTKLHYADISVKATIVSLAVEGNEAWIGGIITQSNLPDMKVGDEFILRVVDNGEGKDAPDDQMSKYDFSGSDASSKPHLPLIYSWTIGNVQVH